MNKTLNTVILFFLGQSAIAQKGIDNLIQQKKILLLIPLLIAPGSLSAIYRQQQYHV
jgi:hypothetical protein